MRKKREIYGLLSVFINVMNKENINTAKMLTLLLLNTTCPILANSVDPDQLASEEAN